MTGHLARALSRGDPVPADEEQKAKRGLRSSKHNVRGAPVGTVES